MIKTKNQYCYSEQTPLCHSELVSESITTSAWRVGKNLKGSCQRANGFRTKSGMTGETGRSMVEMLGVLAIIGLLSIGGIAGYKNAMNKHAANEILNEVSKRAVVGAGQLLLNKGVNLAEFENTVKKTYPIGVATATTDETAGDWIKMQNEFAITVSKVPEEICEKVVENALPTATDVYVGGTSHDPCAEGENTITFAFRNDLTKGDPANRQRACDGTPNPKDPNEICNGKNGKIECANGEVPCGKAPNAVCCPSGYVCTADGMAKGECYNAKEEGNNECATNAQCGSGEFCYFSTYISATNAGKECAVPDGGTCQSVTDGDYKPTGKVPAKDSQDRDVDSAFVGKTFIDKGMNWWSAHNWCLAQGYDLVSKTVAGASGSTGLKALALAVNPAEGATSGVAVWLKDASTSATSCDAYLVLGDGSVNRVTRSSNAILPVCSG